MRVLCFFLISFSMAGASLAGSCDCSPEINNASATVTTTCSKTWSNKRCSLDETGANASQLMLNPDVIDELDKQVSSPFPLSLGAAVSVWGTDSPKVNSDRCMARQAIDPNFLQSAVLLTGLRFNEDGRAAWLFPELTQNALSFAQQNNLAANVCADEVKRQNFQQFVGQFGRGCLIFGLSEQYFELNLNLVGSCPFEPEF